MGFPAEIWKGFCRRHGWSRDRFPCLPRIFRTKMEMDYTVLWRTEPATHWKSLKYLFFHFLSFWLSLHSSCFYHLFYHLHFLSFFFNIFNHFVYHFLSFFLSCFIIFASSGAKIFQEMENYNFPRVFFMFLSFFFIFFYHFSSFFIIFASSGGIDAKW